MSVPDLASTEAVDEPELHAILARVEQTLAAAHAAIRASGRTNDRLEDFHASLVTLRHALEPLRDALLADEDAVNRLYGSPGASPESTRAALALIRSYRPLLADLLCCLPHRPFARVTRGPT